MSWLSDFWVTCPTADRSPQPDSPLNLLCVLHSLRHLVHLWASNSFSPQLPLSPPNVVDEWIGRRDLAKLQL